MIAVRATGLEGGGSARRRKRGIWQLKATTRSPINDMDMGIWECVW